MATNLFGATEISGIQTGMMFPGSLTETYRPRSIAEFVGLGKQKAILTKLAASPRNCGLLFCGGPGTGKTSLGFAFARAIEAEIHHAASQDAAKDTLAGIVSMCHRIPYDFQAGKPCKWHVVLLDEADTMSPQAQNYLLSKLDGSDPCPQTIWVLTANSVDRFEDRFLSRLIQLPKFNSYGTGEEIRALLTRIWLDRAPDAPLPDLSRVPTSNIREALQWMECELLAA